MLVIAHLVLVLLLALLLLAFALIALLQDASAAVPVLIVFRLHLDTNTFPKRHQERSSQIVQKL